MEMSSLERTLTAMSFKEPDRVPIFLLFTMHGAKLLHIPLKRYLTSAESMAKAQLRLQEMFGHDCLYNLSYAAAEAEAFGGEVIFFNDGPPNVARPVLTKREDIDRLEPPEISQCISMQQTLKCTRYLKQSAEGEVAIVGVVMSPFSLPVMQMGFQAYLDLLLQDRDRFWSLMKVNKQFCIEWANLQLEAGANAIAYFDPMASTTIIPKWLYLETGQKVAKETLSSIKGPCVTHMGSGRCSGLVQEIAETGSVGLGVSALEDLAQLKQECYGRMTVIGNLNGIEMVRWTRKMTEERVRQAISSASAGGGFILSDNHGELPFQVPWAVIKWVMDAALRYGNYS
ncbi:MAG: uroporphyrinogen decarboxylase family protein [Methanomassiliicoccales archaeon]